jgi:RNA polymerase sigma factor (TIGR02999 family)
MGGPYDPARASASGGRVVLRRVVEVSEPMAPTILKRMPPQDDSSPPLLPASAAEGELRDLFSAVYEELRRVAHRHLRGEQTGHTLSTTGLVHEAYLELERLEHIRWHGRAYVLAAASQAMRRILIDYAVARRAQKRGGGAVAEPLDDAVAMAILRSDELLALDESLDRLAAMNERSARVVECRFFGGMSVEETAEALGTSPATVKRDWTVARAYLNRELAK